MLTKKLTIKYSIFFLKALLVMAVCFVPRAVLPSIIDLGTEWFDTNGTPIQAHGAGVIKVGNTYYWFGGDRSEILGGWECVSING